MGKRFIALLEAEENGGASRTIMATADPETVAAVVELLRERMGTALPNEMRPPVAATGKAATR